LERQAESSYFSDIKAINGISHATDGYDCDYVEYSTVPDQTGGPFWSILNRIFVGGPQKAERAAFSKLVQPGGLS